MYKYTHRAGTLRDSTGHVTMRVLVMHSTGVREIRNAKKLSASVITPGFHSHEATG